MNQIFIISPMYCLQIGNAYRRIVINFKTMDPKQRPSQKLD